MRKYKRMRWAISLILVITMLPSAVGTAAAVELIESEEQPVTTAADAVCPTYQEAYDRMIALKTEYPEGLYWTNFYPYGRDGTESYYRWNGGKLENNVNGGVGCAAFAFILSDAAFGNLPGRMVYSFTYEDIKVGDILRVNNNSHFVIVLQKSAGGVIVAEGNYNKSVHWGRAISAADAAAANFIVTRYPANFDPSGAPGGDEVLSSGTAGGVSWTLTQAGTLTISGSGAIPDHSMTEAPPWNEYNERINTVIIKDGVTGIGDYAFYQSKTLAVYIPDSVTSIGQGAFYESALLSVTIPSTVKVIEANAFRECPNLTSATVPEGVATIEGNAFRGCTELAYIDFPASIRSVGAGAFMSCPMMTRVRFMPSSETVTMGDNLFTQCYYLTDVTLPLMADRISDGMFHSCSSLSSIYIPGSVSDIGEQPFAQTPLLYGGTIRFGGSEATWNSIGGKAALIASTATTMEYDVEFDNPFAADPDDPGDLVLGESEENPPVDPAPDGHEHNWLTVWAYNETNHWHECSAEDCPATDNSKKDGYAEHSYGGWVVDVAATAAQAGSQYRDCTVCGYRQTTSIPATGNSESGSGNNSGGTGSSGASGNTSGGSGNSDTSDGSNNTSSSAATQENTSGSTTTITTDKDTGAKTETTTKPDGSSIVIITQKDGTVTTVATDTAGKVETEVKLSTSVIDAAKQSGEPVSLPIPEVLVTRDAAAAPAIAVYTGESEPVKASIPVTLPTAGTVAVIVNADGSTQVVKASALAGNNVVAALPNGVTIKVIDNSKSFSDVSAETWYEDAIAFVSARELFAGTTTTTFAPDVPMTRAMLMTVLARFDGAETAGGETWYAKGAEWAIAHGVSDGTNPNNSITREQLVTMIWRYMGLPAVVDTLSDYTDTDQISGYAQEAMCWAVKSGVIGGFGDGRLGPQEQATRAQVAQILKNLIENITLNPTR